METILVYDALLILMLYLLYIGGRELSRKGKILSYAGIMVIIVYTLNEGLRFGRGIDYNAYWKVFNRISQGETNDSIYVNMDIGYYTFCKILSLIGLSWQGCVMLMSFVFITCSLYFLNNYRQTLKYALPLWVLFTISQTENVMRWYFGGSFILLGLSLMMQSNKRRNIVLYILFSTLGCTMHSALIPVVLFFFIILRIKSPVINPTSACAILSLSVVISQLVSLTYFADLFNYFASFSDRLIHYSEDTNYWLLKSSHVGNLNNIAGAVDFVCSFFVLIIGYALCSQSGKKYVFAYNIFLIAFIFRPLTTQMELLNRYDTFLYSFRALVYANILHRMYILKIFNRTIWWQPIVFAILAVNIAQPLLIPLRNDPRKYLYVWDRGNLTPDKMYKIYSNDHH